MVKILAIDTAINTYSVALLMGDDEIIQHSFNESKRANEFILPMVQSILAEANIKLTQLDAIAFGCGPGSFTGIRLAASVAQGLCFGADIPGIPISTLRAIAQGAYREHRVQNAFVVLDAHLGELYFAAYTLNLNLMREVVADQICKAEKIPLPNQMLGTWVGVGDAWLVHELALKEQCLLNSVTVSSVIPDQNSFARDIAVLALDEYKNGRIVDAEKCLPVYLKENMFKTAIS